MATNTYEVDVGGSTYEVDAPDEATAWKWANYTHKSSAKPQKPERSWWNTLGNAALSFIPSAMGVVKGTAEALMSPLETGKSVWDIGAGALQNALPDRLVQAVGEDAPSRAKASAVGQHFANRYGDISRLKETVATDPAGAMADASVLLSGGGGLARTAGLTKTGNALTTASRAVDPMLQSVKGVSAVAKPIATGISEVIGGMGTHTGGESIRQMAKAGFAGGNQASIAASMMRDKGAITDLLDEANNALSKIKAKRSAEYTSGMSKIATDKTVLNFSGVDQAVQDALNVKRFKGKSISPTTQKIQDDVIAAVDDWKNQNPTDFHTAEGLDALKQTIGDIRDSTEYGTPSRKVADDVYNAVKNEIVKQAPEYAATMGKYSEATELISEIQRHLLGKDRGSPITAVNKLQKLMTSAARNNKMEMSLAKELESAGATNLLPGLAGLSLQGLAPRGLAGQAGIGLGGLAILANTPTLGVPFMVMQSPRLMGEAALGSGRVAGGVSRGVDFMRTKVPQGAKNTPLDLYLYQANTLKDKTEEGLFPKD